MNEESWRDQLNVGDNIDCLDSDGRWFESVVLEKNATDIRVHFRGWDCRYDVTESKSSQRVQLPYSRTIKWRDIVEEGDFLEIKDNFSGLWYIATVFRVDHGNKRVTVNYGCVTNKTLTVDIEGENVSCLGTHIRINQKIFLSREAINKISDGHFFNWNNRRTKNINDPNFLCCICYENTRNVVLSPCNHLCVCSNCSRHDLLRRCPLCNVNIFSTMFVYV